MKITSMEEALLRLSDGINDSARYPNIKHYKPHEKQYEYHKSTKKKKLYIGGNRSGKTTGGVCEAIWRATNRHPFRPDLNDLGPTRGRVVAVDFVNGVEKIIFPQYKQWLYPSALRGGSWETAYDKFLRTLYFANGSTIEFMSYDQDLDKFAGTSRHWIHFDEEPPKSIYIENMARLIDTDGDFWITMTPVEGMTWVYDDLYEPNENNPDGDVAIIEISTLQNPYLTRSAVESFISSIDEDEQTSRIGGKFVQVGGRIYKNFDPTIGGIHVLKEPVDDPKTKFKDCLWVVSLDHGLNNPTAVYWTAVDKQGYCTTFREHYKKEWTIDKHAAHIRKTNQQLGREPDLYVADPSIQNRNPVTGTSIHEEYLKYGIAFLLGNNDVAAGIVRFKRYLNPTTRDKGRPRWVCTPNCTNLIWELKRYRWKTYTNKKLTYENNAFEQPQKKDDHGCDSIRYMIMTRPDLRAEDNFSQQVNEVMAEFGATASVDIDRVADPHELSSSPYWTKENNIPNRLSDWEYDEHMGGIY
jgi:phage terminase large subunit-like protein